MVTVRALISVTAILLLLAVVGPRPAQAADTQAARIMVQAAVNDGLASFAGKTKPLAERERLLDGLLRRYGDPAMLSASMLGRYWGKISPAEQTAFVETFMRYLVSSYAGLLKDLEPGVKIEVNDAVDLGARVRVSSNARFPSEPGVLVPADWEVATTADGKLVIMDVSVEGVSIIRAMREDFSSVLRSSGGKVAPLMEALQRKIDANDKANAAQ